MNLQLPGTYNLRDVAANSPALKPGLLFRSDAFDAADDAVRRLSDAGVNTVIDLRNQHELENRTNQLDSGYDQAGIDVVHAPVLAGSLESILVKGVTLEKIYIDMATDNSEMIAEAIRSVAHSSGAVMVHCTAGKDRTGVVVALILAAIGVIDDEILADYALSEANLRGEWAKMIDERLAAYGLVLDDSLKAMAYSSPPAAMRAFLEHITAAYGSINAYLSTIGITAEDRRKLQQKLLA